MYFLPRHSACSPCRISSIYASFNPQSVPSGSGRMSWWTWVAIFVGIVGFGCLLRVVFRPTIPREQPALPQLGPHIDNPIANAVRPVYADTWEDGTSQNEIPPPYPPSDPPLYTARPTRAPTFPPSYNLPGPMPPAYFPGESFSGEAPIEMQRGRRPLRQRQGLI
ncbi:hypothetical protein NM688_g1839 [Phlebia brevispora]|uniref:Uncharacterized protein n=1 Tax=Phlebia brevispora TaxID=194682 RepID=A0ACC1TAN9_9APHY|nr:hypothetical protein NM688_g1839 [Phlebia brevispora]